MSENTHLQTKQEAGNIYKEDAHTGLNYFVSSITKVIILRVRKTVLHQI